MQIIGPHIWKIIPQSYEKMSHYMYSRFFLIFPQKHHLFVYYEEIMNVNDILFMIF